MPNNNSGLVNGLSSLSRREAIIVGEGISMPSRVKIRELSEEQLPDSKDISFIKGWMNDDATNQEEIISNVVSRWTSMS